MATTPWSDAIYEIGRYEVRPCPSGEFYVWDQDGYSVHSLHGCCVPRASFKTEAEAKAKARELHKCR
jgi:hypothetical protein